MKRRFINSIFGFATSRNKYDDEELFWKEEIPNYVAWYKGELQSHYDTPYPMDEQKIQKENLEISAILTWYECHQKQKYCEMLQLDPSAFMNMRILDVGSGPMPSGEVFKDCELFCLDPLIPKYTRLGYPVNCYQETTKFIVGYSERMPLKRNSFDAVISVNSIDHIDDIHLCAAEIGRVLKPEGRLRFHVHYHEKTETEPLELNDDILLNAFRWCENLSKIDEVEVKRGDSVIRGESYNLWSNF